MLPSTQYLVENLERTEKTPKSCNQIPIGWVPLDHEEEVELKTAQVADPAYQLSRAGPSTQPTSRQATVLRVEVTQSKGGGGGSRDAPSQPKQGWVGQEGGEQGDDSVRQVRTQFWLAYSLHSAPVPLTQASTRQATTAKQPLFEDIVIRHTNVLD